MKKIIAIRVIMVVMFLGIFCGCTDYGCTDYGYEYHFNVIGEGGSISVELDVPSPIILRGGKKGSHQLEFIATPDSGYQIKEWTYNGEVVNGNKSNIFTTPAVTYKQPIITITVEFEPMS